MDLASYRNSPQEQDRIGKLMAAIPATVSSVMDAGARDGYIAKMLAARGHWVTAVDLQQPNMQDPKVSCVQGDITHLGFATESFDLVLCAEVLEHLQPHTLAIACNELRRVAKKHVLIGVPYKQDTRIGQTTCRACNAINPPWSHLNIFSKERLTNLFPAMTVESVTFVGRHRDYTNRLSVALLNRCGNPYGSYAQEEPCTHCGSPLQSPPPRTLTQRALTRAATSLNRAQNLLTPPKPMWIHILFRKEETAAPSPAIPEGRTTVPPSMSLRRSA